MDHNDASRHSSRAWLCLGICVERRATKHRSAIVLSFLALEPSNVTPCSGDPCSGVVVRAFRSLPLRRMRALRTSATPDQAAMMTSNFLAVRHIARLWLGIVGRVPINVFSSNLGCLGNRFMAEGSSRSRVISKAQPSDACSRSVGESFRFSRKPRGEAAWIQPGEGIVVGERPGVPGGHVGNIVMESAFVLALSSPPSDSCLCSSFVEVVFTRLDPLLCLPRLLARPGSVWAPIGLEARSLVMLASSTSLPSLCRSGPFS